MIVIYSRRCILDPTDLFVNNSTNKIIEKRNIEINIRILNLIETHIHKMYFGAHSVLYPHLLDKNKLFLKVSALFTKIRQLLQQTQFQQKLLFYYFP